MTCRTLAVLVAAALTIAPFLTSSARAENKMGYQLLSEQEAASLPHNHGALGLDVEAAERITDGGMTFDIIRVKQVRRDSAGAQAGFKTGDEIIALDGHVFPTLVTFGDYIGSILPGTRMMVDYIPAGGGPQQAQRVAVTVGEAGQSSSGGASGSQRFGGQGSGGRGSGGEAGAPASTGMSTGTKIAIGAGAVALLGCYEMGCFSHHATPERQAVQPSGGMQPR